MMLTVQKISRRIHEKTLLNIYLIAPFRSSTSPSPWRINFISEKLNLFYPMTLLPSLVPFGRAIWQEKIKMWKN